MLRAHKSFSVDIYFSKIKFYKAFDSIYYKAGKLKNELIAVQLMNSICKSYMLYATKCVGLSSIRMRNLRHTKPSTVFLVFNITGKLDNVICSIIDDSPLHLCIVHRRISLFQNIMRYFDGNMLLKNVFMYAGLNVLFALRAIVLLSCFIFLLCYFIIIIIVIIIKLILVCVSVWLCVLLHAYVFSFFLFWLSFSDE